MPIQLPELAADDEQSAAGARCGFCVRAAVLARSVVYPIRARAARTSRGVCATRVSIAIARQIAGRSPPRVRAVRAVAGSLDVDSIIEETATMDRVAGELNALASRWGVSVSFVRFQRVDALGLTDVLAKRKNAELNNQSIVSAAEWSGVRHGYCCERLAQRRRLNAPPPPPSPRSSSPCAQVISARAYKQKSVIESEGNRDRMIREAEGEAQQTRSRARGEAKAILNQAQAEAESVTEIARAIRRTGENPTRYLLALKYIDTLKAIMSAPRTRVHFIPAQASTVMSMSSLGITPSFLASAS